MDEEQMNTATDADETPQDVQEAAPVSDDPAVQLDAVALVAHKLRNVLESEGVQAIAAAGQKFDPALHEAVLVDGDGGDFVVAELRRGYTVHGNVIRPALVKVGKSGT